MLKEKYYISSFSLFDLFPKDKLPSVRWLSQWV